MNRRFALILAGGASSRLFPFNKILSDLSGTGKTLIQEAFERARRIASKDQIFILAGQDLVAPVARRLKLSKRQFFVDPVRRGTWPALMWAMAHLRRKDPDAVLAVLTGDHLIPRLPAFERAARRACALAEKNPALVLLAVEPRREAPAWMGYGVFRIAEERITAFAEKPTLTQAEAMLSAGGWQWNSGMFFFRISTAERALAQFQPAMHAHYLRLCEAIVQRKSRDAAGLYAEFPAKIPHPQDPARFVDNTIDFAIMTPLVQQASPLQALGVSGGLPVWTDLGQWDALDAVLRPDHLNNRCLGNVTRDRATRGCILAADQSFSLAVHGLIDAVAAVSARGVLLLPRCELPRIKEHVAQVPPAKFLIVNAIPGAQVKQSGRKVVVSGTPFIR